MDLADLVAGVKYKAKQAVDALAPLAVAAGIFFGGAYFGKDMVQSLEYKYRGIPPEKQISIRYNGTNPNYKIVVQKDQKFWLLEDFCMNEIIASESNKKKAFAAHIIYWNFDPEEQQQLSWDLWQSMGTSNRNALFVREGSYQIKAVLGGNVTEPRHWYFGI